MQKQDVLAAIRTLTQLAQAQYNLSEAELHAAIFSQTIPATIFTADSTPLEAVVSYLHEQKVPAQDIARSIGRTTHYVQQIINRGKKHQAPKPTPYLIPLSALKQGAAGSHITAHLASYGLTTKQISELLHKDESTVWTWRKRGEKQ